MFNGNSVPASEALAIVKKECLELLKIVKKICDDDGLDYWIDGGTFLGAVRHGGFIPWDDDLDICLPKKDYDVLIGNLAGYCKVSESHILIHGDTELNFCFDYFGSTRYLIDGIYPVKIDIFPAKFVNNKPQAIAIDKSLVNIASIYFRGKTKNPEDILDEHKKWLPAGKNPVKASQDFFEYYSKYMLESMELSPNDDLLLTYSINDMVIKKNREYFRYNDVFPLDEILFEDSEFKCPKNKKAYLEVLYGDTYMKLPEPDLRITHLNKLYVNDISYSELKQLLNRFYYFGFINHGLGWWAGFLCKPVLRVVTFIRLSFYLLVRFRFKSFRNLLRYSYFQVISNSG